MTEPTPMNSWLRDRRGFSLVEAVVALALLGVALAAILPGFAHNMRVNTDSELRTQAVALAQQEIDRLRASGTTWPTSGTVATLDNGITTFESTLTHGQWCEDGTCFQGAREILLEIRHQGRLLYRVETVFTSLDASLVE